eukprot:CAMPEP_0172518576 /NCGR_PEP_ID=MMETSP1066-20121228/290898_1 /TAXON_ID=671091 /ORGANISM="Coscinodiscus wailesii, Strain CCMP2513" /LENGTH=661 /DNA_ID=CAMNT_0013300995 /DNA_START=94 /DNA_END=2079 /DNA_ORIENTATION=+
MRYYLPLLALPLLTAQRNAPVGIECDSNKKLEEVSRPCMCGLINDWEEADASLRMVSSAAVTCSNGFAGQYPCSGVDLLSLLPLSKLNEASGAAGDEGNDCWGWTDPGTGREFAIMGVESGTAYVEVTDPVNPVYVGKLPSHAGSSMWGDIKTYNNYAYAVSENHGQGMQILELTQLKNTSPGSVLTETAHHGGFGNAHNIFINEDTGFAYVVGSNKCSGGLYMMNLKDNPTNPDFVGCFSDDGYTHDVQCVIYKGSDNRFTDKEICFALNEDTITIIDVTNKQSPTELSRTAYDQARYVHQGWLTEDHNYLLIGDELDETQYGLKTRTIVLNVKDLMDPEVAGINTADTAAIDHNMYVKGNHVYQANYRAGLRILGLSGVAEASLNEVAYFDIYPSSDSASFNGAWSTYPFFNSGTIIVSGIEQGLFVLKATGINQPPTPPPPTNPPPTPTAPPVAPPTNPPPTNLPPTTGCGNGEAEFSDSASFNGAWSTYPFFNSGTIIVSGIEQGLFVLKATGINQPPTPPPPTNPPPTPTAPPVAPPTNPPTTNPPPTTGCGNGEAEFRIEITTDNYPGETTWDLRNECSGSTVIEQGGPYTTTGLQTESYCVASSQKYKFTINDEYGDGICCSYGNGKYKVTFNGMTESGDQFGSSESKELGSCV